MAVGFCHFHNRLDIQPQNLKTLENVNKMIQNEMIRNIFFSSYGCIKKETQKKKTTAVSNFSSTHGHKVKMSTTQYRLSSRAFRHSIVSSVNDANKGLLSWLNTGTGVGSVTLRTASAHGGRFSVKTERDGDYF